MKRILLLFTLLIHLLSLSAQRGGENVYTFLQLTNSARVAALGGENVSISDADINLVFHNPALLQPELHQNFNLNYINYFAGVNYGYTSYAEHREGIGTFAAGIHFIDHGIFERRDEYGTYQGAFRASEYALNLIYSRGFLDSTLYAGVNLKPIFSVYEQYTSLGIAADFGVHYINRTSNSMAGLVIRNVGTQITTFAGTREAVPFEIQAGFTQGLAHAPFRFSIQLQHLERWDLTYELEEQEDLLFGNQTEVINPFGVFADKFMRHAIFGVELLFGENFHIDMGYNYKRRQEMKMNTWPGMVGFSWGVGFRVSKFHFAYGRASYHLIGGTNHFSLTTNLSEFYKAR